MLHKIAEKKPKHQLAAAHQNLPLISTTIRRRILTFAGHCVRQSKDPISELVLWEPIHGSRRRGHPEKIYVDILKEDTGITTTKELEACMMDRKEWRKMFPDVLPRTSTGKIR